MSKKNKPDRRGYVYSTDPNFQFESGESFNEHTLEPGKQKLRVRIDTKQRAGKAVTLVEGFQGSTDDLEDLGKKLKTYCGTGGSVKDHAVIIQGDQRDKLMQWLMKNGYTSSKKL